jgi:cyclophilin family peptidyl-prolyl cis-trans isomerase
MFKKLFILLALSSLFFVISCDKKTQSVKPSMTKPEVKTGVAPIADNEVAIIEMENPAYGKMKVELYSNIAPQMVARFKELAKEGFYNGTIFHRIEPIVIQGGDPTGTGMGKSNKPNVPAELSDVPFERGILGAARSADYNSANSQFYITLQNYPSWKGEYTAFGKVIEGMNNADTLAGVPKNGSKPIDPVKIKNITIQPK